MVSGRLSALSLCGWIRPAQVGLIRCNCSGSGAGVSPAAPGVSPALPWPRARRPPHYLNSYERDNKCKPYSVTLSKKDFPKKMKIQEWDASPRQARRKMKQNKAGGPYHIPSPKDCLPAAQRRHRRGATENKPKIAYVHPDPRSQLGGRLLADVLGRNARPVHPIG